MGGVAKNAGSSERVRQDVNGDAQKPAGRADNAVSRSAASVADAFDKARDELFSTAITALGDVAYRWTIKEDIIHWADGVSMLLGIESAHHVATNRSFGSRVVSQKGAGRYETIMRSKKTDNGAGVAYELEYQVKDDFGGLRWVEDRGRWFADADGNPSFAVGVLRSIEARRTRDDQLVRLSTYDELTGLLNRIRLKEAVGDVIAHVQHGRGSAAFLLLAIDNLTLINDSYGFDVADEVIVGVGQRLRGLARRVDAVGRYSGNKFGLVLRNCSKERLISVTERLLASVRDQVIETSRGPVATTVSAGCVSLPAHAQSVEHALGRAEEALTVAKQMRRDSYVIYTPSREREKTRQYNIDVTDELVSALNDKRICLAYQPVVSSVTGEVMMHECLIRLVQPDGSIAAAGNFVPIAEKLGLIGLLDFRAMELTMEMLRAHPDIKLSLNVSGRTTSDRMWLDTLVAQLRADRSLASRLIVEITETVALQEIEGSAEFVKTLRELGCQVAIDDFGAGYTSFRNLQTIEVDLVKIDGSFVQDLVTNRDNQFFVRTLVDLAHNFDLPIIAEWVGNAEEVAMLRDFGVEYLQGFFLGEPALELPMDQRYVALTGTRS